MKGRPKRPHKRSNRKNPGKHKAGKGLPKSEIRKKQAAQLAVATGVFLLTREVRKRIAKQQKKPKRDYLPYHLTEAEKRDPHLRAKLASCIYQVEKKECPSSALKPNGKYDYNKCRSNPVAICRASVEGLGKKQNG